jgi:hypothetical protein
VILVQAAKLTSPPIILDHIYPSKLGIGMLTLLNPKKMAALSPVTETTTEGVLDSCQAHSPSMSYKPVYVKDSAFCLMILQRLFP